MRFQPPPIRPPGSRRAGRRFAVTACLVALGTGLASATLVRRMDLPEVVRTAETIVEGKVTSVRSFWEGRQIWTEVAVAVSRSYKGRGADDVTFRQLGGSVEEPVPLQMTVPGAPRHLEGDGGFYFLTRRPGGHPILVGVWVGHVPLRRDDRGEHVSFDGRRFTPDEFAERIRTLVIDQSAGRADDRGTVREVRP